MFVVDGEWAFVHAPKTMGTSLAVSFPFLRIKTYLGNESWDKFEQYCSDDVTILFVLRHLKAYINITKHAPLWFWQEQAIVSPEHKVFTTVRNPYSRIVSYYCHLTRCCPDIPFSFKDFVYGCSHMNKMLHGLPFAFHGDASQLEFYRATNGSIVLHRFYRMEDELGKLRSDFALDGLHHINTAKYTKDYSAWYDDDSIDRVRSLFSADFEAFGYSTHPFWLP